MAKAICSPTDHRFVKFDDGNIFCQRCGTAVRIADPMPARLPVVWPTYPVYPLYPYRVQPYWTVYNGNISTSGGGGEFTVWNGSPTVDLPSSNTTISYQSGTLD